MTVMIKRVSCVVMLLACVGTGALYAQSNQASQAQANQAKVEEPPVPLKATIVLSRWQGDKRTARLPFELWVNTDMVPVQIRTGSEVPIPNRTMRDGVAIDGWQMRTIGTNIDGRAETVAPGLYRLRLTLSDQQIFRIDPNAPLHAGGQAIQSFTTVSNPILRDGQSAQYAVASDKITGETIRLEVTLAVVK